jgi:hypothetical protein
VKLPAEFGLDLRGLLTLVAHRLHPRSETKGRR